MDRESIEDVARNLTTLRENRPREGFERLAAKVFAMNGYETSGEKLRSIFNGTTTVTPDRLDLELIDALAIHYRVDVAVISATVAARIDRLTAHATGLGTVTSSYAGQLGFDLAA